MVVCVDQRFSQSHLLTAVNVAGRGSPCNNICREALQRAAFHTFQRAPANRQCPSKYRIMAVVTGCWMAECGRRLMRRAEWSVVSMQRVLQWPRAEMLRIIACGVGGLKWMMVVMAYCSLRLVCYWDRSNSYCVGMAIKQPSARKPVTYCVDHIEEYGWQYACRGWPFANNMLAGGGLTK
jgi:hypothetical protein